MTSITFNTNGFFIAEGYDDCPVHHGEVSAGSEISTPHPSVLFFDNKDAWVSALAKRGIAIKEDQQP